MNKACLLSFLVVIIFLPSSVKAITNNNDIFITDEEYDNLISLGFTEQEILNMEFDEFNNNKNLEGYVIDSKVTYDGSFYNLNSSNTYSTTYKKITTSIVSVSNKYRYKVSLEWLRMPSTRSYDIIGIGIENSKVYISSNLNFKYTYCVNSNCTNSTSGTSKITSTGGGFVYKLSSGSTITSMNSYLYFEVSKNTSNTITNLKAYGDYAHATSSISSTNANNYSLSSSGININNSYVNYFDNMNVCTVSSSINW